MSPLGCVRAEVTGFFPFTGDLVEGQTDPRVLPYRATGRQISLACSPSTDREPV